ncbi:MAG: HD domain-containing protein [Phycisphaerae bacterium]|nr:HD domain-containing protein [Phycisphaerae bacterium]
MKESKNTTRDSQLLLDIIDDLGVCADEMGLVMTVWDSRGKLLGDTKPGEHLCQMLCGQQDQRKAKSTQLAHQVLEQDGPIQTTNSLGCCMFGLPIREYHKTVGAVVLGYPTSEMIDEEHLGVVCDQLHLDREPVMSCAQRRNFHSALEAPNLMRMFNTRLNKMIEAHHTGKAITSLSDNLANSYEELALLHQIGNSMKVSKPPRRFLQDICRELQGVMNIKAAAAIVYDKKMRLDGDMMVFAGESYLDPNQIRMLLATHIIPKLAKEDSVMLSNDFTPGDENTALEQHIQSILAVPLCVGGKNVGTILAINKNDGDFDTFDIKLLNSIAGQASVFLANNHMFAELQDLLMGVLHSLTETIDAKDPYTCGHSRRVAAISRRLAEDCGFDAQRIHHIYLAGLLHDIGKIGVPEAILCKDGKLTDEEYESMKRHPTIGAKILERIHDFEPIIAGVLSHHERLDGRGYPRGLKEKNVPVEGRIVGLADSFDAMTSHRTYRNALSLDKAIEELKRCSGTQFDTLLVEMLLSWDLDAYMEDLRAVHSNEDLLLLKQSA